MPGKLTKLLMGLGGSSALAGGGLLINALTQETDEERKKRLKEERTNLLHDANKRIEELEVLLNVGNTGKKKYLLRSDMNLDFWAMTWISKVWEKIIKTATNPKIAYSLTEKNNLEIKYWKEITLDQKKRINFPLEKIIEIEGKYRGHAYWIKYRELCILWALERGEDSLSNKYDCASETTWGDYRKSLEYEKYLEYKEEKARGEDGVAVFYWTVWWKFMAEERIKGSEEKEEINRKYLSWKAKKQK